MESEFGIHNLRSGMLVETSNGDYFQVELGQSHNIMIKVGTLNVFSEKKKVGYINLSVNTYNKDITTKNRDNSEYDIVRVYDFIKNIKDNYGMFHEVEYYTIFDRYNICMKCIHNKICKYVDINKKVSSCKEFLCV